MIGESIKTSSPEELPRGNEGGGGVSRLSKVSQNSFVPEFLIKVPKSPFVVEGAVPDEDTREPRVSRVMTDGAVSSGIPSRLAMGCIEGDECVVVVCEAGARSLSR